MKSNRLRPPGVAIISSGRIVLSFNVFVKGIIAFRNYTKFPLLVGLRAFWFLESQRVERTLSESRMAFQ
jgi:hypothetical protein